MEKRKRAESSSFVHTASFDEASRNTDIFEYSSRSIGSSSTHGNARKIPRTISTPEEAQSFENSPTNNIFEAVSDEGGPYHNFDVESPASKPRHISQTEFDYDNRNSPQTSTPGGEENEQESNEEVEEGDNNSSQNRFRERQSMQSNNKAEQAGNNDNENNEEEEEDEGKQAEIETGNNNQCEESMKAIFGNSNLFNDETKKFLQVVMMKDQKEAERTESITDFKNKMKERINNVVLDCNKPNRLRQYEELEKDIIERMKSNQMRKNEAEEMVEKVRENMQSKLQEMSSSLNSGVGF